jgi:hypothetical protein
MTWCFSLFFALLLCCGAKSYQDDQENLSRLSRIMLCTVVDVKNPTVVRDSLTLFRSIALFGKSLNHVTKVIGIPSSNLQEGISSVVPMEVIRELLDYKVQVVLFPPATPRYAGTMNKFNLLKVLPIEEADYILWLDADTIILDDPIDHLPLHKMPGEISCVPEFYSYMRRYPTINTTESFWNPSLPVFTLIGDHEVAPHGMCNTGVMYFDRYSLRTMLDIYDDAISSIPQIYHRDRFFDSLIFVYGVNMKAIMVNILPYSLNYMAFFEGEILQLTETSSPLIAHLLSDAEFFCAIPNDESPCDCYYNNEFILPDSKLVPELQKFLYRDTCTFMATGKSNASSEGSLHEGLLDSPCQLIWPPKHNFCPGIRKLEAVLQCSTDAHVAIDIMVGQFQWHVHNASISSPSPHSMLIDLNGIHMGLNESGTEIHLQLVFAVTMANGQQLLNSTVTIPNLKKSAKGKMIYGYQPLLGSKPISLESQLEFFDYLSFYFKSTTLSGVVMCCDTTKGILTVGNILQQIDREQSSPSQIQHSNALTHVIVRRLPVDYEGTSLIEFVNSFLRDKCPRRCVFWVADLATDWPNVMLTFPDSTFDFALIDSYGETYDENKEIFQATLKKLKRGGIMLGTNYILQNSKMGELIPMPNNHALRMNIASYSVHSMSWEIQHNLLFTYLERNDAFCGSLGFGISVENCYPAWYLHKSITL